MTGEGTPLTLCTQCHCAKEGDKQAAAEQQSPGHPDRPSHLVQVSPATGTDLSDIALLSLGVSVGAQQDLQKSLVYSLACWLVRSRVELN